MKQVSKIKEAAVGDLVTIPLVIKSVDTRETKAKKPYLSMELFDGKDSISGNYWDWQGSNIPERNKVYDFGCQVSEWMGNKQLSIKSIKANTTCHLSEFIPASDYDIGDTYKTLYVELEEIKNEELRTICLGILEDLKSSWTIVPGAKVVHHAYTGGTLVHTCSVVKIAKALAQSIEHANVDLTVAGAFLHDVGKLFTYKIEGVTIDLTSDGLLFDHTFISANFVMNYADGVIDTNNPAKENTVKLLCHVILAHHGKLEHGAPVSPSCIEAHIVHHADALDVAAELIREAGNATENTWTDRIWALENRPAINHKHIAAHINKAEL